MTTTATYKPAPRSNDTARYYEALGTEFVAKAVGRPEGKDHDEIFISADGLKVNGIELKFHAYIYVGPDHGYKIGDVYLRRVDVFEGATPNQTTKVYDVVRAIGEDIANNASPSWFLTGRLAKQQSNLGYVRKNLDRELEEFNEKVREFNGLAALLGKHELVMPEADLTLKFKEVAR